MFIDILFWVGLILIALVVIARVMIPSKTDIDGKSKKKSGGLFAQFSSGMLIPILSVILIGGSFLLKMYPGAIPDVSMPSFNFSLFDKWSAEEREEVESLVSSFELYFMATDVKQVAGIDEEDWESINAMLQAALSDAEFVSDEILKKVHPDMPAHFNEEYKPGLSTGIWALSNFPPIKRKGTGDTTYITYDDSIVYSRDLLGKWIVWYTDNKETIEDALVLD